MFPSLCDIFEEWNGRLTDSKGRTLHRDPNAGKVYGDDEIRIGRFAVTMDDTRRDFFALIDRCPNLDFLLLTKRPENVRQMWPRRLIYLKPDRKNVWLLYSASDQASLEAGLPHLLACRDLVPVLGLSLEPLVGPVDLGCCLKQSWMPDRIVKPGSVPVEYIPVAGIDWVIVGGESGPRHRPMELAWLESIADQCSAAGVPLFVKQDARRKPGQQGRIPDELWDRKELPKLQA